MIQSHGVTDAGCVRSKNEDRIFLDESSGFFILSDGMGGHRHGELAAELATSTVQHYLESSQGRLDITWPFGYNFELSVDANRMSTAIQMANRQVWKQAETGPEYAGMGTTVAAAIVNGSKITVGNVGDSRVYLYQKGSLRQLTVDDTWVNAFSGRGGGPKINVPRNLLTQAAGSKDMVEVHTSEADIAEGDVVLLCSDGLYSLVPDAEIEAALAAGKSLTDTADNLLRAAKSAGGEDNISIILLTRAD